ncbi:hypothetical protein C8R43DRAFT_958948 [Mycena crocata]|nr:hypothetical protein C8R43DRAFT_958948 [Mycena crocata]
MTTVADLWLVNTAGCPLVSESASGDVDLGDAGDTAAESDDDEELPDLLVVPDSDDEGDLEMEEYDEDLFTASPTLPRLDAGDVSLDMDVDEWYLDQRDDSDSDSSDSDYDNFFEHSHIANPIWAIFVTLVNSTCLRQAGRVFPVSYEVHALQMAGGNLITQTRDVAAQSVDEMTRLFVLHQVFV